MYPLHLVAQNYKEIGTDYAEIYRVLSQWFENKELFILPLLESGSVVLFDGYEYRATEEGYVELHSLLRERGY